MGQTNDKPAAKRPGRPTVQQAARFDSARFVQYELDSAQAAQCKAWDIADSDLWNALLPLLDDGYSATIKFDSFNEAYACFVQIRGDPAHANAGIILAGRGSTPAKAVKQVLFKIDAIGFSWLEYAERPKQIIDD